MGVYNLLITAVWALCFVTNVFIDSCAICFGDYLDSYAAFAVPCSKSLNHRFRSPRQTLSRSKGIKQVRRSGYRNLLIVSALRVGHRVNVRTWKKGNICNSR